MFNLKNALLNIGAPSGQASAELPLRAELFSALQMEQHGRILASAHHLSPAIGTGKLLSRLAENEKVIIEACKQLTEEVKANRQVTPAAEWLLDNFYLIEEQIRTAKRHLPKDYSKQLPLLLSGDSAGKPRVYGIALETISHGDGRVDPESLSRFVVAYQTLTTLKLGELWAIPIMLRLALIENLRRVAARLATTLFNRTQADSWVEAMMETAEIDPSNLILLIADMARSNPPMDSSFVAEMVRRLMGHSPALTLPLTWLSQRLAASGQTIDQLIQLENQQQAADQVSISNSIGSLRLLGTMDWREFVETISTVNQILETDPSNVYANMEFATRDLYRHVVEHIAKYSKFSEADVANKAIELASSSAMKTSDTDRTAHVGYYLIGNGLPDLQRAALTHMSLIETLQQSARRSPLIAYLGSITLLTLAATGVINWVANSLALNERMLVLTNLLGLVATNQLALSLVNWLATVIVRPRPLPRMDFSVHIPKESRTIVAVPTMIFSKENIDNLTEALEVRFLANNDLNLTFCLLTDFCDSKSELMQNDEALLIYARKKFDALNGKYCRTGGDNFLLFHRQRRWNQQENCWMGYERKRGKLAALNAFLLNQPDASNAFSLIVGNTTGIMDVKYVITLDTDTELPRNSARKLIATMAHPLNQAYYDEKLGRVSEGYGILQPRVETSLSASDASRYELLCGGETGIDPYTRTSSDVYQDVFGEGSFIGKGIYDIHIFEHALRGRMPENRILSHDLLEGCYVRSGLLSDVDVYEAYPSRFITDATRRQRWVRGDWQIASWLMPKVPGGNDRATGQVTQHCNPLSALSHWKLFDNLRRSVLPFVLTLFLLLGWMALPSAWVWTGLVFAILFTPSVCAFIFALTNKTRDVLFVQHFSSTLKSAMRHVAQATLTLTFLPFDALLNVDAILRTLWRVFVSHKKLLQWNPSSESMRQSNNDFLSYCRSMWIGPATALSSFAYLISHDPTILEVSAPILLLWLWSPAIAYWISQPIVQRSADLTHDQTLFLTSLARKTWLFFETYVGPKDNWLPPDNVQEHPLSTIAHRTSPTNIGLSLLANLAAYDFGYIPIGQFIERSQNTLKSMAKLERYLGHFYNWYDTRDLKPLSPLYVSSVDSGNLAGHLLTLRSGFIELLDAPILSERMMIGIRDTCQILRQIAKKSISADLDELENNIDIACKMAPTTLTAINNTLQILTYGAEAFLANLETRAANEVQLYTWAQALASQCRKALSELDYLTPWAKMPQLKDWLADFPWLDEIPKLRQLARLPVNKLPMLGPPHRQC